MPHIDVQLDHHMVTVGSAPPLWPKAELTAEPSLSLTPTTPPPPRPEALADALAYAGQHGGLSAPQLAAALSGVRVLAKVTGRSADQLPAAPQDLTPVIQDAFPARHRIRPKRWANAVSAIRALLRACGLHAPVAPARPPSCPAWATLVAAIPTQQERSPMLGFARWCSDAGIHPAEVTEQTVENYSLFRQCQTIRTGLIQVRSSIRRIWNRCVRARLPGWPSRVLIAPQPPNVEALPLSSFPVSFQSEIASLMSRQTHPDAFDPHSGRWRPGTASAARRIFIRAASLEARRRGGPEHVTGLADIVTTDTFEFVMRHLYERSNRVWREYAATFATYLAVLARDFVQADAATLARIQELRNVIIKRVREHRKPGLSERVHGRLMPFDDPRLLRRFFMLPGELYRVARMLHDETPGRRAKKHPVRAAQMHEQALMLDLLQRDPMRRYNLASINVEEDFIRDEKGRIIKLWMSGERTKNGIELDMPISPDLEKRIRAHLTKYRPLLQGATSPWLFPSPAGAHRAPDNVTKSLGRVVRKALGVQFTPHMMRHILATVLYRRDPHNGVVVQRKLRHSNVKITETMYGRMSNAGANGAWQREVERYRRVDITRKSSKNRQR